FIEHYPLPRVEKAALDVLDDASKTAQHRVRFFVGLDEPLMRVFGSERIVALCGQLGLNPDESLRHPMIDRAIENAQKRLQARAPNAVPTRSAEEWFALNLSDGT